jgi:S1-C subfamily serine protease
MEETREGLGFREQRYEMSSTEFGPNRPETDQERQGPPPGGSNAPMPPAEPNPPQSGGWTPPRPAEPNPPLGGGWAPPPAEPNPPLGGGWAPPPPAEPNPPQGGYPPPYGGYPPSQGGYPPPPYGGYPPPPSWSQQPEGWNQMPAAPPPPPSRRSGWLPVVAIGAAIVLLMGGLGAGAGVAIARNLAAQHAAAQHPITRVPQANGSINQNGAGAGQGSLDIQSIAKKVDPAVVDVNTVIQSSTGQSGEAAGTGMILTSGGQVLTNNHVVDGSSSIKVTVQGRSNTYTANVVGTDRAADVALLQLQGASALPTATVADSSTLKVGEGVVALGNALGQGGTPSASQGSITALDQSITASTGRNQAEQLTGLIQSDAPISPGDSGGPLVNSAGQVIGMITAGESQGFRRTTSTVGYAIPSNAALDVINQIRAGGAGNADIIMGQPGYLGVAVQELSPDLASSLGVSAGVQVVQVVSGSPAQKAGIAQDAVITAIDGKTVASQNSLSQAIQAHKPGQQIKVNWQDQSGTHSATVTLVPGANA